MGGSRCLYIATGLGVSQNNCHTPSLIATPIWDHTFVSTRRVHALEKFRLNAFLKSRCCALIVPIVVVLSNILCLMKFSHNLQAFLLSCASSVRERKSLTLTVRPNPP